MPTPPGVPPELKPLLDQLWAAADAERAEYHAMLAADARRWNRLVDAVAAVLEVIVWPFVAAWVLATHRGPTGRRPGA